MFKYSIKKVSGCLMLSIVLAASSPLFASAKKDVSLITKAASFIQDGAKGNINVAVVFDPNNADSTAHANEIAGLMKGKGRKVKLHGKKVAFSNFDQANQKIIFVTRGMSSHYSTIARKGRNGTLIVSNVDDCLGKACTLVVKSSPSVDILLSTASAASAGINFASAFSMMITKK